MFQQNIKRASSVIMRAVFLFTILMFGILLAEENSKPLKIISIQNNAPFTFNLPDGTPTGIYVEMWNLWSKTTGQPIEHVIVPYAESISMTKSGEGVHSGLFIDDERTEWADFSVPFHEVQTGIIYNQNIDPSMTLTEAEGLIIGTQEGSYQDKYLTNHHPQVERFQYNSTRNVLEKLIADDIQAVIGEIPFLNHQLSIMGLEGFFYSNEILFTNTVHATVSKGQPELIELINRGWNDIPIEELVALEKKWLPSIKPYFEDRVVFESLTLEEQLWLSGHGTLTLGVEHNDYPYEFLTPDNTHSGLVGDFVNVISNKLNINFSVMSQYQWRESFSLLQSGEIDVMGGVVISEQRAESINFSKPYFSMPTVIITKQGTIYPSSLADLVNLKVGVIGGYSLSDYIVSTNLDIEIVETSSDLEGLMMLSNSEIDAYVGGLQALNKVIQDNELFTLQVSTVLDLTQDYAFAIRKGLEPLVPIVNKVIDSMSQKQKLDITNNWLAIQINEGFSLVTILQWLVPLLTIILAITAYVINTNRRLSREVNERKRIQTELVTATSEAKQANKAKSEFLANMSHEIRTPMNAVLGMCQVLKDTDLSEEQKKNLEVIHSSSDTLLMLINDILDLSKIEAGKLELENSIYELSLVLSHLESQINLLINNRKVKFTINATDQVPALVKGDRLRLGQILLNLCNNAAKFTHEGEINLEITVLKHDAQTITLKFIVSDTGIGMTEQQLSRLFKTYSQADSSISREYGGTGLGLMITKHLVELMNGSISVDSEYGEGSSFSFDITQEIVVDQRISEDDSNSDDEAELDTERFIALLKGKSVLIVDDNQVNLLVAKKLLAKARMNVSTAEDGITAVESCRVNSYDAVLMDLQMPIMDGYAATVQIRKQPENTGLPIIALSANVMQADIDRCFQVGMNAHLPKPLDMNRVLSTLVKYISTAEETTSQQ